MELVVRKRKVPARGLSHEHRVLWVVRQRSEMLGVDGED
jgi:hypothetical protein